MQPEASAAANDDVADAADGSRGRRAARFQYATGDQPLDGYTIKRGVGRGGFGEVYFATSDAGKEVALKLICRNLDIELRGVRQCLNLKHPNLVALYDLRTDTADDQWVVMEYVAGESLEDAIARHPDGMPLEEALAWLRGIAGGVGYLHASGIVHRDLKPANIYLERGSGPIDTRVKIGDYGLSKFISTSRRSGQTESVGTVHYMAPEIAGGRYGREIDTYALGVILYEMLTGRVPFEGESVGEVLMKHLTADPDLARLGDPYRTMVARALAKDPELRLSSVDEMLALLPSAAPPDAAPLPPPITPTVGQVWAPVSRPPHTDFPTPQREPLWQALVDETNRLRTWWRTVPIPPLGKALILFAAVTLVVFSGAIAIPVAVLPFYLVYYVIWSAFLQDMTPAPAPERLPETAEHRRPAKPSAPRRVRYNWRSVALRERSALSTREKAASLTGSMLGAAVVAIVASGIAAPLLAADSSADYLVTGLWLAVVTTLGSWGVLAAGAFADAHRDDHPPRRGLNLLVGLALAGPAFGLVDTLGQGLPFRDGWSLDHSKVVVNNFFGFDPYAGVGFDSHLVAPTLTASVLYFGVLFLAVRWWRSTDYLRRTKVGFFSIAFTAGLAWLASVVCWYPQPLGMVIAATIALATQAASPWCPPSRRAALARGGASMEV